MTDRTAHTKEEEIQLKTKVAAEKARDGPAKSTRSQTGSSADAFRSVRRLQHGKDDNDESFSYCTTVFDVTSSSDVIGRCDDGSDKNIANPKVAKRAVHKGIRRLELLKTD